MSKFVIGLDFGTDSVRALLVNAITGEELITSISGYKRWRDGKYCDAGNAQFRQHPLDYLEGMEVSIKEVLANVSKETASNIVGLSVDTTSSTIVAVDKEGVPLALHPKFSENPNAMFILWKDHTANSEAEEINALAHKWSTDYTKYSGGTYSSEWFWSKILHIVRRDEKVYEKAFSWVEHCDWIPAVLAGQTNPRQLKRSRCAAGHKAMWHEEFNGLPSEEFFTTIDKKLKNLRQNLYNSTYTADQSVGTISKEWATRLGLPENTVIGVGAIDAHFGAVGAGIKPYSLVKVIGTSTCDMIIAPNKKIGKKIIKGICGQVDGSIIPNMLGMEAGQSAFGDLYAWFQQVLLFPVMEIMAEDNSVPHLNINKITNQILPKLSEKAAFLPVTDEDIVALDWINGRRTPDADLTLKAAIANLNLASTAPHIFKGLVEATAFGSKAIIDRFNKEGIPIKEVIALGGVTKKSAYVVQTLANVLNMSIKVVSSEQTCALGGAMFAATVAGIYPTIEEAQKNMCSKFESTYKPDKDKAEIYRRLYKKYNELGAFMKHSTSQNYVTA